MEINKERQAEAINNARKLLVQAEEQRRAARIAQGLAELEKGNLEILKNDELALQLPQQLLTLFAADPEGRGQKILEMLGESTAQEEVQLRERGGMALSIFADRAIKTNDRENLLRIAVLLGDWLRRETEYLTGLEVVCRQIGEIGSWLIDREEWRDAEQLLETVHHIQNKTIAKNNRIRGIAAKTQERVASKSVLEKIVDVYLVADDELGKTLKNILAYLSKRAVVFLLNRVMHSEMKEERLQLVRAIPHSGPAAVPVLVECLEKKPPWYVIRNIVYIISEMKDPSLFSIIEGQIAHRDIRVQNEVIECLIKLGPPQIEEKLIGLLPSVADEIKPGLLQRLARYPNENVGELFYSQLERRADFTQRKKTELMTTLIVALRQFPSEKNIRLLKEIYRERKGLANDDRIKNLIEESLRLLEPQFRHISRRQPKDSDEVISYDHDPVEQNLSVAKVRDFEQEIQQLIREGEVDVAGQKIFHRCISAAREKDFLTAEMLRDRLLEINPYALSEVVKAGEMIEEMKSSSITGQHLEIWADLYDSMATEEFNALYYGLHSELYGAGEIVARTGETDPHLYFINSGFAGINCETSYGEKFLKRMQPGEIIGAEQFFSASVWTATVKAQTELHLHVLDRESLAEIQKKYPGIESKLQDYCLKYNILPELVKMAGEERRDHHRYTVSAMITNMLLDSYGNMSRRSFKGELLDISEGGLCFSIRLSSKENGRLLLGRHVQTEIGVSKSEKITCVGRIVGVQFLHPATKEYTVHVKLLAKIGQDKLRRLISGKLS